MTLDQLTEALAKCDPTKPVAFDFGKGAGELMSWRGVYAQLTLTHGDPGETNTAASVLKDCRSANGRTFQGYKGGDYAMDGGTAVWADDWGSYNGRMILSIEESDTAVTLQTGFIPDEYRY